MAEANPILNNPYEEPARHYATNPEGELDYETVRAGRRIFTGQVAAMPVTTGPQKELFSGLREIHHRFKLRTVYDLSATPYYLYLTGSGHEPYSLFQWVVSDESHEGGLKADFSGIDDYEVRGDQIPTENR